MFCLDTKYKGNRFFCNRSSGDWAIAVDDNHPEIREISRRYFFQEPFIGTQMVVINISRVCNFDCEYCFAEDLKGFDRMSELVGRKAIDRVLELPERSRRVVFHGNEPITNYSLINNLVDYAKNRGKIIFAMQTNGSIMYDDQLEFLSREKVGIGISLDGLARHHNKSRPYRGGFASFDDVVRNVGKVKAAQGRISVITVITKDNVHDLEEIVKSFGDLGIDSVSFNPTYPHLSKEHCPPQEELSRNMIHLFDMEIDRILEGNPGTAIVNLRDILRTFFIPKSTLNCVRCSGSKMHPLIGIDIDGSIYPCDMFWDREEFKIGDIFQMRLDESFNCLKNFRTYRNPREIDQCSSCDWLTFCGAECPGISIRCDGAIASKGHYCDYRKKMLEYGASKIPLLHEKGVLGKILGIVSSK